MRAKIKIDFIDSTGAALEAQTQSWPEQINVQTDTAGAAATLHGAGSSGYKGFQLDSSPLNGAYKFFGDEGYPGVISRAASDENGNFETPVTLRCLIRNAAPKVLWISFDPACQEYATDFSITESVFGMSINVENNKFCTLGVNLSIFDALSQGEALTLSIKKWSKPNASAKLVRMSPYFTAAFSSKDLIDFVCSENLLDSNLSISPGICEQYADVKFYDREGILHSCAQQEALMEDPKIVLYALDDSTRTQEILGTYFVSDWNIPGNSSEVTARSRDMSYVLSSINVPAIPIADRTVDDMLELLFSYIPFVVWRYKDTETESYCKSIETPNSWFLADTLYALLDKICTLGMLRIYWFIDSFIVARCW